MDGPDQDSMLRTEEGYYPLPVGTNVFEFSEGDFPREGIIIRAYRNDYIGTWIDVIRYSNARIWFSEDEARGRRLELQGGARKMILIYRSGQGEIIRDEPITEVQYRGGRHTDVTMFTDGSEFAANVEVDTRNLDWFREQPQSSLRQDVLVHTSASWFEGGDTEAIIEAISCIMTQVANATPEQTQHTVDWARSNLLELRSKVWYETWNEN